MGGKYWQILAAVLLGVVVPSVVVRLSLPPDAPTTEKIPETTQTTDPEISIAEIWVEDGSETHRMELETYLVGVILAEMPTSYDHDALCAQAVVARTYALKRQAGERHPKGAVCTDPDCCQAYVSVEAYLETLGYPQDVSAAEAAVKATQGMVVTYDGELIEATYFHCAGGRTEKALAVWGVDYPYLQAVESPGEEEMDGYYQRRFYTKEELESLLDRQLSGTSKDWLGWTSYTVGNGVERTYFAGNVYTGVELRSCLHLNSTVFFMEPAEDGLWITTLGKGHRVGMSQTGAQAMALQGSSWQQILAHYYPGTRIDKMTDLE